MSNIMGSLGFVVAVLAIGAVLVLIDEGIEGIGKRIGGFLAAVRKRKNNT